MRATLLLIAALGWVAPAVAGQYRLSNGWPSGIGAQFMSMSQSDVPLCEAVEHALLARGDLPTPFMCETPLVESGTSELARPAWFPLSEHRLAETAERLEALSRQAYGRRAPADESGALAKGIERRIEAGEVTINIAKVPNLEHRGEITVLRYQRGRCTKDNWLDAGRIEFFRSDTADLSQLEKIRGPSAPSDAFVFRGELYFYAATIRQFDDSSRHKLAKPQSAIYISKMYDETHYVAACRLLYWESDLTPRSKGRAKARPSP